MRRAILLGLAGAGIVVAVMAIVAGERDHPHSAGAPGRPATPAERPAAGRYRQIPLPVPPDRLALVGSHLLIASSQAGSVEAAAVRACRWLATVVRLPNMPR
jgi:hypothetical protein